MSPFRMSSKQNTNHTWPIHILVWAMVLGMPLFMPRPDRPMVSGSQYLHLVLIALSYMAVFYVNYFLLIRKYMFNRRLWSYILLNLAFIAAMMYLVRIISFYLLPPPDVPMQPREGGRLVGMLRFIAGNGGLYLLVVGASLALRMTSEWFKTENLRQEAEKERSEAELKSLKSQLNPHFLFNTLNNIYSLIQIDQDRAQDAVHDLSRTLHYVLYDSSAQYVSVRSEVKFLQEYISLMKIRLPRHVEVSVSLPDESDPVMDKQIAPMLFISPVENAFKHGVSPEQASSISIDLHWAEGSIVCDIRNSDFPKTDSDRSGSGIGIENLKKRLEILYPGKYSFEYWAKGGEYESILKIEL